MLGDIMHAGAFKDARPIKVMLAEEVAPGADTLHSSNVGVHHEMDPAAQRHIQQVAQCYGKLAVLYSMFVHQRHACNGENLTIEQLIKLMKHSHAHVPHANRMA